MPRPTKEQNAVAKALAEVAGDHFKADKVDRTDNGRYAIPKGKTYRQAALDMMAMDEAEEVENAFTERFMFRPWDVAAAVDRAIKVATGLTGIGQKSGGGFFMPEQPPRRISVRTGVNETITVPYGTIQMAMFEQAYIEIGGMIDENYGQVGTVTITAKMKYAASIEGFWQLVREELNERSIYKGKAFTGGDDPEFLDLAAVDPNKVVYSSEALMQMETSIFAGLRYPDAMRANEVPEKRAVLLEGQYGTGKTLALILTAQEAVANGWTVVMVRPGKDNAFDCLKTAQLYAPAVVLIEDVDTIGGTTADRDAMSRLLDAFDGIQSKNKPILVVLTTNHPELITKGMLRPGRLDALIPIGQLDATAVRKLVTVMANGTLDEDVDFDRVFDHMEGFLPAFVTEAVARAKRAAIVRGEGVLLPLTTADLVAGAVSLRPQFDMMHAADEHASIPTLDATVRSIMRDAVDGVGILDLHNGGVNEELTTSSDKR